MFNWLKRELKANPAGSFMHWINGNAAYTEREYEPLAREAYQQNAVAFACIHRIATAAASVKLQVCRELPDGSHKIIDNHPMLDLLYRPNPTQSGAEFLEALLSFRLISGNAYITRSGLTDGKLNSEPNELWILRPDKVEVIQSESGMPLAYKAGAHGKQLTYPVDQITGKSDLLHIKSFNPLSHWYGQAGIESAAHSVDTFNAAQKWNYSLLANSARPSGALMMEAKTGENLELTEDQYARQAAEIKDMFTGDSNAGKPLLLQGGLKWQEMSLSPKDMDFKENQLQAARWIATAFGVPEQMLGIPGRDTFNNMAEAKLAFWEETVLPLLNQTINSLNNWLAPQFDEGIKLKIDEDSISALEPRRELRYDRAQKSTFMTENEKRRMVGLSDDLEGGDILYTEQGKVPLSLAGGGLDDDETA